ncbi:MAG TPA: amino acid synthesis family protein [Candidatus Deferrimicrobiaceae bacterium]|nr:amino acid synthesis family protein [Candidatus Deferrimicrobiaceae bacterium]
MAVTIRKWATFVEEIHEEGGKPLARPLRRAAVAVVVRNPYAGSNPDDLSELIDFGEFLGEELTRRCKEALGTPVESYGKGGIVGEAGELEQIAACLHPKFGAPTRAGVGGVSILPSVKKRAAMGASLDIPLHHVKAMLVRSHFDAMEIRVPDAPAADEIVLALAVADGGRPHARVGGLKAEDVVGEDGLR